MLERRFHGRNRWSHIRAKQGMLPKGRLVHALQRRAYLNASPALVTGGTVPRPRYSNMTGTNSVLNQPMPVGYGVSASNKQQTIQEQ